MAESVGAEKAGPAGKASPEEMLKQAVGAASAKPAEAAAVAPKRRPFRLTANGRLAAATCAALVGGVCIGLGLAEPPRERSGEALLQLRAGIEAGRAETLRLSQEVERLARTASALREASEATRTETKALGGSIGRLEQGLDKRFTTLSDTFAQAEREQGARLAGLTLTVEKKLQAAVPAPPKPEARIETKPEIRPEAKPEPVQTASLPDRAKPETVEGWAVRDVYDGVAILEDRRRRLVEVGAGDAVPGVGRVEAIERRGRNWVVVTRQGLITPQAW